MSRSKSFYGCRGEYRFLRFASLLTLCASCSVDVASQGVFAHEGDMENVSESTEEVIIGSWAGPFTNGNAGATPLPWWVNTVCEVGFIEPGFSVKFYPGRLVHGSCRFVRNGQALIGATYYTWQLQNFTELQNPGFTPNNAIAGSGPGQFPVCRPTAIQTTSGRVQGGQCHYEDAGLAFATPNFVYAIKY